MMLSTCVPLPLTDETWRPVRQILAESFPDEEIGPIDVVRDQINMGSRLLWVNDVKDVHAVAITCALHTERDDVLLEFLAVDPSRRSHGVGGRLLADVLQTLGVPLILEVEDPDSVRTHEATRRIAFYERLGGTVLPCTGYAMPNLASGSGTQPMRLIEMDKGRAAELTGEELRKLVTAIWTCAYDQRYSDDDLHEVLASLTC